MCRRRRRRWPSHHLLPIRYTASQISTLTNRAAITLSYFRSLRKILREVLGSWQDTQIVRVSYEYKHNNCKYYILT